MGLKFKVCAQCHQRRYIGRTKKRCKSCRRASVIAAGKYEIAYRKRERKSLRQRRSPLKALPYDQYLLSDWWKERKRTKILSVGCCCEECGIVNVILHVHHLTYKNLGNERDEDLQVLCEPCHKAKHPGWK